ncbi:MAG TPA: hypothetical protein VNK26_06550, partial [Pyrinomonadaceae bacterium]|nr:hypothetical protein [Pyrinomonadaceae bacterium]
MRDLQPKHSLAEITARLTKLPSETRRIALEQVANMAGVSFRLARLFADRAPFIAERFPPAAFKAWADFGRKLAIIAPDAASNFFVSELPANFDKIPLGLLPKIFELASKQLILSSSNAVGSLSLIPEFVDSFEEKELDALLELAAAIADRSAQHSSNFLAETPRVAKALNAFGKERALVFNSAIRLMHELTARAGGLSADLWAMLPTALEQLSPQQAVILLDSASAFLRFGGSATLHFVNAASSVLRSSPEVFESWNRLACTLGDKR